MTEHMLTAGLDLIEQAQQRRRCICRHAQDSAQPCICRPDIQPAWEDCAYCAPRIAGLLRRIDELERELCYARATIEDLEAER